MTKLKILTGALFVVMFLTNLAMYSTMQSQTTISAGLYNIAKIQNERITELEKVSNWGNEVNATKTTDGQ